MIDLGTEYPTLIRVPRNAKKKLLLNRYDYLSLSNESDFFIQELSADEKESFYYEDY